MGLCLLVGLCLALGGQARPGDCPELILAALGAS